MSNTWRYKIQYGPEGEANYAWVYFGNEMVCTAKTHHALAIVAALSTLKPEGEQISGKHTMDKATIEACIAVVERVWNGPNSNPHAILPALRAFLNEQNDAVDNMIDFILSDETPVGPEDQPNIDMFDSAIASAKERLATEQISGEAVERVTDAMVERGAQAILKVQNRDAFPNNLELARVCIEAAIGGAKP